MFWAFLVVLIIGLLIASKHKPTTGRLLAFKTKYTLNSPFTNGEIDLVIKYFVEEWTSIYPDQYKPLKKAINKLLIKWYDHRIPLNDNKVLAFTDRQNNILHLWIGPKLKNHTRNILYTGLLDQLTQLAISLQDKTLTTTSPEVKRIISNVRLRLYPS